MLQYVFFNLQNTYRTSRKEYGKHELNRTLEKKYGILFVHVN